MWKEGESEGVREGCGRRERQVVSEWEGDKVKVRERGGKFKGKVRE